MENEKEYLETAFRNVRELVPEYWQKTLKQRLADPCPACHSRRHLVVAKQGAYRGNMILKCNCDGFTNV
jgi:hypothetical protein